MPDYFFFVFFFSLTDLFVWNEFLSLIWLLHSLCYPVFFLLQINRKIQNLFHRKKTQLLVLIIFLISFRIGIRKSGISFTFRSIKSLVVYQTHSHTGKSVRWKTALMSHHPITCYHVTIFSCDLNEMYLICFFLLSLLNVDERIACLLSIFVRNVNQ